MSDVLTLLIFGEMMEGHLQNPGLGWRQGPISLSYMAAALHIDSPHWLLGNATISRNEILGNLTIFL